MESGAYKSKGDYQTPVYEVSDHIEPISSASNIRKYEANMLLSDFQNNFNNVVRLSHYYVDKVGILKSAIKFYSTFTDRKSTRLNSSHVSISYAVFCLKKKTKIKHINQ